MIAIIGGGPAGIALAAELDALSIGYELFEERQLAATWRAAPPDLRVLSPWWTNVLRWRDALRGNPFRKSPAREYVAHLLEVSGGLRGAVHERTRISAIETAQNGHWRLFSERGERGVYSAVVLATGYFFRPMLPQPEIVSDGSLPMLHAAQISDYAQLNGLRAGDAPVVVVGRRVTAGQLMLELNARGIACALSLRSPIEYRRHGLVASLREAAYFFWEELQARLRPGLRRPSYPVMDGGATRALVDSATVKIWPKIDRIERGALLLEDGRRVEAAAVVLATGYRAVLDLLPQPAELDEYGVPAHRDFELRAHPGLYLLGFDNLYDHRSRYLRGIRADARRLAHRLSLRSTAAK